MSVAFIFPGQGSQGIGMGKALYDAFPASRAVFDEVDAALGQKLSTLMFEGAPEELMLTANAQPALMAVSLAALRALEVEAGVNVERDARFVAGHSLGEYSALAAAGALKIGDAARVVAPARPGYAEGRAGRRGRHGGPARRRTGTGDADRRRSDRRIRRRLCEVANDNGGGQIVISGARQAVELAIEIAKANGIKRAMLLPVSAPFHCALMQPAAEAMQVALAETDIQPPVVDLVANVTAAPTRDPDEIRKLLVAQVCGAVRWRECMGFMHKHGVDLFVEIGAGKVLAGLVKRTAEGARALNVGVPADVASFKLIA